MTKRSNGEAARSAATAKKPARTPSSAAGTIRPPVTHSTARVGGNASTQSTLAARSREARGSRDAGAATPSSASVRSTAGSGKSAAMVAQIDDAVARYRSLLETADRAERASLMQAVLPDTEVGDELDEALFGPAPTDAEAAATEIDQLVLGFERRREVAAASLTREAAAELLEVTKQAVLDYLTSGQLVGLREGHRWLLPAWQFDADTERGFLPGIALVRTAFPGGVVSLSRWITRPNPDFEDRAPRDAMAAGHADKVAAAAAALTSAGW